jgi:hypothetical protein
MPSWHGPVLFLSLHLFVQTARAETNGLADAWLTNTWRYPAGLPAASVRSNLFSDLHSEVLADQLTVSWTPSAPADNRSVIVLSSTADVGHWPARDWRPSAMRLRNGRWQATVPVEDLDLPLIYFVSVVDGTNTNCSPMRIFAARAAGLEMPTRIFWPFLEGFEEGTASWRLLPDRTRTATLGISAESRHGNAALLVSLPARPHSATVATTRVRGWQLQFEQARGLSVWMRSRQGTGRVQFTLYSHAFDVDQLIATWPKPVAVDSHWQRIDLDFRDLPGFPLGGVDLLTFEFVSEGPQQFLVDDLQLLGPWTLVPD